MGPILLRPNSYLATLECLSIIAPIIFAVPVTQSREGEDLIVERGKRLARGLEKYRVSGREGLI